MGRLEWWAWAQTGGLGMIQGGFKQAEFREVLSLLENGSAQSEEARLPAVRCSKAGLPNASPVSGSTVYYYY